MCVHGKSWKSTALRYFKLRCIRVWIRAPVPSSTVQLCKTNLLFSLFQWQSKGALNKSCFYSIWWQKRCTRNALAQRDLEHSMSSSASKASPQKTTYPWCIFDHLLSEISHAKIHFQHCFAFELFQSIQTHEYLVISLIHSFAFFWHSFHIFLGDRHWYFADSL